ncbi:hypothetical protein ScPMuIL_015984 [Solemya velum]
MSAKPSSVVPLLERRHPQELNIVKMDTNVTLEMETIASVQNEHKLLCLQVFKNNLLVSLTVFGVILGFVVGFGVRTTHPSQDVLIWTGLCGEVYMRMVKMMVLPLIISSVITGTASLDPKSNGRISVTSLSIILVCNTVPCLLGAILAVIINPGVGVGEFDAKETERPQIDTQDIFTDLIRNLLPDNIVTACFQKTVTVYEQDIKKRDAVEAINGTNSTAAVVQSSTKGIGTANGANLLGLIIMCTLFGIAIGALGEVAKPMFQFFRATGEVILRVLRWLVWFTPLGVASLIAKVIAGTSDLEETFRKLGIYIMTIVVGLVIMVFIIIPVIYFIAIRTNPFRILLSSTRSVMITLATTSTAIAMPETLRILENEHGVDRRVSRFAVPLSVALMRGGSTLYITVSCLFIIQLVGQSLTAGNVLLVIVLTAMSSVAIPSVPSASLVTVIILLTSLNVPADTVGLLLAVEWFL